MTEDLVLIGTFEEKPFPALLLEIKDSGKTGILVAKRDHVEKRIFFQNGEPIASRSTGQKDLLGEILCARGKISRAQLDEALLESKKDPQANLGHILTGKGVLPPKDLYSECKYQFVSIFFSVFAWEKGSYSFTEQEASSLIPSDLPRFRVKFSKLVSEGIRLIRREELIDRLLGDSQQMVYPTSISVLSKDLSFKGEEETVLEALGLGRSIKELAESLTLDSFLVKKILYALSCLEVLEIRPSLSAVDQEIAEVAPVEIEEELPALSESSLSAMMNDLLPENRQDPRARDDIALPQWETAARAGKAEKDSVADLEKVAATIQLAVDEAGEDLGRTSAPEVQGVPAAGMAQAELVSEEPVQREVPAELDETLSAAEETTEAPAAQEIPDVARDAAPPQEPEEPALEPLVESDQPAMKLDEGLASAAEPEQTPEDVPEPEEAPSLHPDEVPTQAVEKEAREITPIAARKRITEKKSPVLVLVSVVVGAVILFGGMALFYFLKARESKTLVTTQAEQSQTVTPDTEVKKPAEMAQPPVEAETATPPAGEQPLGEKEAKAEVPLEDKGSTKQEVSVQKTAEPAAEQKAPAPEKTADVQAKASPPGAAGSPKEAPSVKQEGTVEAPPPWVGQYEQGLKDFKGGNLNSAFKNWSNVIRSAPNDAYAIQIEITSYMTYTSRDIQEASKDERVFIVKTELNEKPAYKVICGIYQDRSQAEEAFKNLSPYLRKQHPTLVSLQRLKGKLTD